MIPWFHSLFCQPSDDQGPWTGPPTNISGSYAMLIWQWKSKWKSFKTRAGPISVPKISVPLSTFPLLPPSSPRPGPGRKDSTKPNNRSDINKHNKHETRVTEMFPLAEVFTANKLSTLRIFIILSTSQTNWCKSCTTVEPLTPDGPSRWAGVKPTVWDTVFPSIPLEINIVQSTRSEFKALRPILNSCAVFWKYLMKILTLVLRSCNSSDFDFFSSSKK